LLRTQGVSTLKKVLEELVLEKAGIPKDMFGVGKGEIKPRLRRAEWRIGVR
jgi:hypothetical protein